MAEEEFRELVQDLAAGYPGEDLEGNKRDIAQVLETVLPALAQEASDVKRGGKESPEEIWKTIRNMAESAFEKALQQSNRLKVLYVTSKFMNNKKVGTAITDIALNFSKIKED